MFSYVYIFSYLIFKTPEIWVKWTFLGLVTLHCALLVCLGVHPLWEELVSMWLNTTLQFCIYSQQLCFWMSEFLKPCLIDKQKFPQDELTCRVCVCPRFCIGITDFPFMQVLNSSWWFQLCSRAFATSEVEFLKNDHQPVDLGVLFLFKTCKSLFYSCEKMYIWVCVFVKTSIGVQSSFSPTILCAWLLPEMWLLQISLTGEFFHLSIPFMC